MPGLLCCESWSILLSPLFTPACLVDWWLDHLEVQNWFNSYQVGWCLKQEVPEASQALTAVHDSVKEDDSSEDSVNALITYCRDLQRHSLNQLSILSHILNANLWEQVKKKLNRLPREAVVSILADTQDPTWSGWCCLSSRLDKTVSRGVFQPQEFCDSMIFGGEEKKKVFYFHVSKRHWRKMKLFWIWQVKSISLVLAAEL